MNFCEMLRILSEQNPQQPVQQPMQQQRSAQQAQQPAQQAQQPQQPQQQQQNSQAGLIDIKAGPGAVLKAAENLTKDPNLKKVLLAGKTDGKPNDEVISIVPGSRMAKDLEPTQSEIGTQESLDDQIMDKYNGTMLNAGINGGKVPSADGQFPILTFGNQILDGHHRWSQVLATNPNAKLETAEITAPGVGDAKSALGLVHTILFALYGQSPTKPFKGQNIYEMNRDAIKEYVKKNIVDSALQRLAQAGLISSPDREQAAEMYANNIELLKKKKGAFPRTVMPQPLDAQVKSGSEQKDGLTKTPEKAASGEINYISPKPQDLSVINPAPNAAQSPVKAPVKFGNTQLQAAHTTQNEPTINEWLILAGLNEHKI